jgi:Domain of unknown function (DUF4304)
MQKSEGADSAVKRLLVELNVRLRPFGFRRRGQTFARQSAECWQVVNVQLSRFSQLNEKSLTVNIGIHSKTVLRFRSEDSSKPPLYYACPITFRIGWLMEVNDKWWTVRDETSAQIALTEIDEVLQGKGLPFLDVLQTNKSILDLYKTGEVLGFEIDRDETRLLLLVFLGANDEAQERLEEYRSHWPKTGATDRASKFLKDFQAANSQ